MAANFIKGFVSNFVKNSLNLEKPRPAGRKGASVLRAKAGNPLSFEEIDLIPSTPRYCANSAKLLRMVGLWGEAKRGKLILCGKTLLAWYHTGSQLPWDKATHLIFAADLRNTSAYQLAESLFHHLRAVYRETHRAKMDFVESTGAEGSVSVRLTSVATPPDSLFAVMHFVSRDLDGKLVRAVIDGGNAQNYVFANRSDLIACMQEAGLPKNGVAKLPIPKGWSYDTTLDTFFMPSSARQAFMWPPSVSGAKFWGLLAIVLLAAYLVGMYVIPSLDMRVFKSKQRDRRVPREYHATDVAVPLRDAAAGRGLRRRGGPHLHTQTR
jgi:hypothetical protein